MSSPLQVVWKADASDARETQERCFDELLTLIDKDADALRCRLEAKRQAHQQERFLMLQEVAGRRLALMDQNIDDRPYVDLDKLMDLTKFDQSDRCRDIVSEATASARCRAEATRALMLSHFEEAKQALEAQLSAVQTKRDREQQAHEAKMANLTALVQAKVRLPTRGKDRQLGRPSSRTSRTKATPRQHLLQP
mmetsp:Transcript_34094/g.77766  ORF Transcript_34094/g.77766 Transcript_34094/m.77766 type:complete len:194 (-) Transcript_34094:199-780(-)